MAETSRSRVTITLGRSGQVVKRAGPALDSDFSDSRPGHRNKRSVRDRLGSDVDRTHFSNKRQRGDANMLSMNGGNGEYDTLLGKDDLRYKLIRKNVLKRVESDVMGDRMDLRETLSRPVRPNTTNLSMRQRMPEPTDPRYLVPERKDTSILGQIPSTRSADALPKMDSLRNSYSPWNLDQLRQRSPDKISHTSRILSPQKNQEEIMKRPLIRTYDDARTVPYTSRDILEPGRHLATASSPYMTRLTSATAYVKPVVAQPAPSIGGIVPKSSYTSDEHFTVDSFLHSLGLEKYAICFKAEEVDMTVLRQMGDNDLKELGIPMGPRKKIQLALLSRSKRQL